MLTLCLVNTYDKLKLHEIHLRCVARAAPLCYAFGLHLALMDFPFWEDERDMVSQVCEYTTIGENGKYLEILLEEGKIHIVEGLKSLPAQFGEIVATTSKPDQEKKISVEQISSFKSATFLMGLGRRGLPRKIMKKAKYHWDVTMKGISLETCTAMGVITAMIGTALRRQGVLK